MKKQKLTGKEGFEIYYQNIFGERWANLKTALQKDPNQIAYTENLLQPYYLDFASVQAALALPPLQEGSCLDMCAAPGGKTLVLSNIMGENVQITANELSASRRNRLLKVLEDHLQESNRARIKVTGYDASKMPKYQKNVYDRILLDAPCSSERHVIQDEKYLSQWTESRIKNLAQRQWSLLSAAFLLLKQEGFLVYSTCALSEIENDFVIDKLKRKYKDEVVVIKPNSKCLCEKTNNGNIFLPDSGEKSGPIYFSLIQKKII